jgi:hypothetical protein
LSFDKGSVWYNDNFWVGFTAGGAITKGNVVVLGSGGTVTAAAGVNRAAIGVALASASSGGTVPVALRGIVWVTAGGAISKGAFVTSAAGGKVAAFADFSAPASYAQASMQTELNKIGTVIGIALDAASDDGDKIRILLTKF